jgi:hypothetical protein
VKDVTRPKERQATTYCAECQQKFCEDCADSHRRVRLTRGHTLLEIGEDGRVPEGVEKMFTLHCDKHLDKVLELYCFECNEVICLKFVLLRRTSHINVPRLIKCPRISDHK